MSQHRLPDQIPPPSAAPNAPSAGWVTWVRDQWGAVRVTHVKTKPLRAGTRGRLQVRANVHLGSLAPADVLVEATANGAKTADATGEWSVRLSSMQSYRNGTYVYEGLLPQQAVEERCRLTVRVLPGAAHEAFSTLGEVARAFDVRSDVTPAVDEVRRTRLAPVAAG
jgi:hypothetical protein